MSLPSRRPARRARVDATPLLFAELADDGPAAPPDEPARRLAFLRRRLDDAAWCAAHLPPRLAVFGVSTMPPAFLSLLQQIASRVPVQLFVPQPTPHYVGDLRARRTRVGENALLARFGAESREFQDRLVDVEAAGEGGVGATRLERIDLDDLADTLDATSAPRDLLRCVQADVVAAFDRSERGAERFRLAGDDPSLRVHDCHGPQRELEVVRDQIARAMTDDESLQPRDFLVLVPDIDRYAPYAQAVFGPLQHQLPFHVADRHPARELPICRALLLTLDLVRTRLTVADVLHLLETPAVQHRFGLFANDVPQLRHLCQNAGIRWGRDAASRERRFDLPAFADNSWRQGLERLLLGSLTGPLDRLLLDRAPVGDVTESRADLLQRFLGYVRTLFALLDDVERPRPLSSWAELVDQLVTTLFAADTSGTGSGDDADALRQLQRATVALRAQARTAQHDEPVSLAVLRDWLDDALGQGAPSRGFLGGSITIAAMLPMRAVPVRCLFLCGLDDASFPRRDRPAPFDLMAQAPRPGDRNRRLDDRQLFLDLLLAARDRLHLTFVGHSAKDNAEGAPSVVLSELLDHLDRTCETSDGRPAREHVVVQHPLQPWSLRYAGEDPRLFTFQELPVATPHSRRTGAAPWCPPETDLVLDSDPDDSIALDDLLKFWWNPSRTFLRESLGLRVRGRDDAEEEDEPFLLDNLARYRLQDEAVQRARRGEHGNDDPLRLARAEGMLPVGFAGEVALHHVRAENEHLEQQAHLLAGARSRRIDVRLVDADGAPAHVQGELDGFTDQALVYLRASKLKAKDRLRAWLRHLLVAVQRQQPERSDGASWPEVTLIFTSDGARRYASITDAEAVQRLGTLIAWYRRGVRRPIEFFEHASFAAAEALDKRGKDVDDALRAAWRKFQLDEDRPYASDLGDVDTALCMRDRDPFGEHQTGEFLHLVEKIWMPLLTALQEHVG
ncbi:MAG: exodeoxyribonuclease V subunit gamma [Planctomycetes bacterium]|nr:exodeoxyribonuclease V subunit gamma [Planctomycetota bacterium]